MKTSEIKELFESFESIAIEYDGVECWSARELSIALGYSQYRNFLPVVEKAKDSCLSAGENLSDHFADVSKMASIGSDAERLIDDVMLTRYNSSKWRPSQTTDSICSKLFCSSNS